MSDQEARFRRYEKLVKKAKKNPSVNVPAGCKCCPYFAPEFRYRKCAFASCPYGKVGDVFRKHPLKRDKFS